MKKPTISERFRYWFDGFMAKGTIALIGLLAFVTALFILVVTVIVALVTLYFQLQDPAYRGGVYAVAGFYLLGLIYFAVFGRNHLILSPEEEFAMSKGEKGHA